MNNALDKIWILNDSVWNKSDLYLFWKIHTPVLNKNILDIMSVYANSFCACNMYATSTEMCVLFSTCIFSDLYGWWSFMYCLFVILHFIPMYFLSKWSCLVIARMRFLYVFCACTLFFTCLCIIRNDENVPSCIYKITTVDKRPYMIHFMLLCLWWINPKDSVRPLVWFLRLVSGGKP